MLRTLHRDLAEFIARGNPHINPHNVEEVPENDQNALFDLNEADRSMLSVS